MATGHDIAMGLRAAYLSMHRQTNSYLAPYKITADQFVLLALLAEQDGITQQELVRRATSDPNTIRAMLVLMENRGLVTREPHPADGRARNVTLTRTGRCIYTKLSKQISPLQNQLMDLFRLEETEILIEFLGRISETMTHAENHHGRPQSRTSNTKTLS
jgi:DNA-binding MarR family transcriptional regulator